MPPDKPGALNLLVFFLFENLVPVTFENIGKGAIIAGATYCFSFLYKGRKNFHAKKM